MTYAYWLVLAMIWLMLPVKIFAADLSFNEALSLALQHAPLLTANQAQIDAARSAAIPAGALPDPQLALGVDNLPIQGNEGFSLSKDFMTMQRIGLSQAFPNTAKLDARVAVAQGRLALAQAQTRVVRLQVLQETAVAWIAIAALDQQLQIISDLLAENQLFAKAVKARFAGGQGVASDTLVPRFEAAMLDERRDELVSRRAQAVAQLKRWIGEAADKPLFGAVPDWPMSEQSLAHGLHRHPELDVFVPKTQVLDAEVAEAKAEKIPDWAVQLAYQRRGSAFSDMVSLQVSIDLPMFADSRQQPKLEAKLSERNALEAERMVALDEHNAMLSADLADYQRLSNAEQRAQSVLIPLAEEKVALSLAAWRSNQSDLATLIAARKELLDTRLKAVAVRADRQQLAARLHFNYGEESLKETENPL